MRSTERSLSQREQLEAHLSQCPDCANMQSSYEALRKRIHSAAYQTPLPDLTQQGLQIRSAIEQARAHPTSRHLVISAQARPNIRSRAVGQFQPMPSRLSKGPLAIYSVALITTILMCLIPGLLLSLRPVPGN